ncbi:MAG: hypothetical protein IPG87_12080 [Saprospiraceae bacterium]|nr:hypothetical protein [Candidatus Vicinibacter affinis]
MKNLFKMMVGKGRERFRVFYFYFLLFILAFSCSKDDSAPGGGKIETGSFTEVLNENVGVQGKVLTVQGGDVNGLTIEIPQGSYKSGKDFVISTAKINSHTFGPDFNPLTPMIRINNGGGYADSILTVTIPCVVPQTTLPWDSIMMKRLESWRVFRYSPLMTVMWCWQPDIFQVSI